ncbi:MAG: radical SAM protein [Atopobiaceae bacterium]|nr:radical SAM protein [Atopobiaceae bacterium]
MRLHFLQWHITHRCNLRCAHCYQKDYTENMDEELLWEGLEKYVRYLMIAQLPGQVNLTGGEPLMHHAFWDLAERIVCAGLRLGVLTNGTMINEEYARRLAMLRPVFVQVSLDGVRDTHNRIRGEGSFERALRGIDYLKAENVHVLVSFTAQKQNYRDFRELSIVCRHHRVDKLWWDRVVTEDTDSLALTTEEFKEACRLAARRRWRYRRIDGSSMVNCGRPLQFLATHRPCLYRCGAGGDLLIYLANGDMMPCRRLPFVIGNYRDGELAEIIARSEVMRQLAKPYVPTGCENCKHLNRCRGGSRCVTYAQTRRLDVKDVNCWL